MKKKLVILFFLIIILVLIIIGILLLKARNTQEMNNTEETTENIMIDEIIETEIVDIGEGKRNLEEYIKTIYPVMAGETFPIFDSISNADNYWIWSTAIVGSGIEEMGTSFSNKKKIIQTAKELYGNNIPEFPKTAEELEKLDIHYSENNDTYSWIGNSRSIPKESKYIIISKTEKENGIFEVKIAEYLVYEWAEPYILIEDINGNILKKFNFDEDYTNSEELEREKKEYIENSIDKFNKKILRIKYDRNTGLYQILSAKSI